MTSKTTNRYSPEVRACTVRMVLDREKEHALRWAAVESIAGKIGCAAQTLHEWTKKAEVDTGARPSVTTDVAQKLKRSSARCARPKKYYARHRRILRWPKLDRRFRPWSPSWTIIAAPTGSSRSARYWPIAPFTYHEQRSPRSSEPSSSTRQAASLPRRCDRQAPSTDTRTAASTNYFPRLRPGDSAGGLKDTTYVVNAIGSQIAVSRSRRPICRPPPGYRPYSPLPSRTTPLEPTCTP